MQKTEKTIIQLGNKVLTLQIRDFGSEDINVEDLLQVDTFNLVLDLVTFPVIFNRIANIKAEMDNLLRETKFDVQAFEAQLYEKHKKRLLGDGEKATETSIDMAIKRDPDYKIKKFHEFQVQKQADILDGLYWAAKSKDKKLDSMSAKIRPEDFETEILEGTINSVMIKSQKNIFKQIKH